MLFFGILFPNSVSLLWYFIVAIYFKSDELNPNKLFYLFTQDALNTLFVKINEASVAEAYGIEQRPSLVVFEQGIPNVYEGDLYDSDLGLK